jgi:hypothetical protein
MFIRPCLKIPFTKIRLEEWLKVKVLSSSPRTGKKKKKRCYGSLSLPFLLSP